MWWFLFGVMTMIAGVFLNFAFTMLGGATTREMSHEHGVKEKTPQFNLSLAGSGLGTLVTFGGALIIVVATPGTLRDLFEAVSALF